MHAPSGASGSGSGREWRVSDLDKPLLSGTVQLSQEQVQLILKNQQQFLTIFHQQLTAVIQEQAKTNSLLLALIEAMGEGDEVDSLGSTTYLDGSPMR